MPIYLGVLRSTCPCSKHCTPRPPLLTGAPLLKTVWWRAPPQPCRALTGPNITNHGAHFLYEPLNYLLYIQHSSLNKIFRHLIWRGRQTAICNISFVFFIKSGMTVVGAGRLRPQVLPLRHSPSIHSQPALQGSVSFSLYLCSSNKFIFYFIELNVSICGTASGTHQAYLFIFILLLAFSFSCSRLLIEKSLISDAQAEE